jgi:hypothetical protein
LARKLNLKFYDKYISLKKIIKIKDLSREYNLRSNDTDLALPKPKTNYLKRSFKYSGTMPWNGLPSEA